MTENTNTKETATEAESKAFIKPNKGWDGNKDWSYLDEKEPDQSHYLKGEMLRRFGPKEGMPEMTAAEAAKVVQAFLAMHRWMQQSDLNQSRADFRGRTWESVEKGYETLAKKAAERIAEEGPTARMVDAPRAVTGLKAEDVLKEIVAAPEAPEEAKEIAEEAVAEVEEAKAEEAPEEKPVEQPKPRQRRQPRKKPAAAAVKEESAS